MPPFVTALSEDSAVLTANNLLDEGLLFLKGSYFTSIEVMEEDNS